MPSDLTPHSLRRTFASLLVALGRDPAYFMAQMGHTTANLTLSLYAKAMASEDGERERLRLLLEGVSRSGARPAALDCRLLGIAEMIDAEAWQRFQDERSPLL